MKNHIEIDIGSAVVNVVSDMHFGALISNAKAVARVLKREKFSILIVDGDGFDDRNLGKLTRRHWKIIARMAKLKRRGVREFYIPGNHCPPAALAVMELIGVEVVKEITLISGGKRVRIEHGHKHDLFCAHPWITVVGTWVRDIIHLLDFRGDISAKVVSWFDRKNNLAARVRNGAIKAATDRGDDLVICGHSHAPEVFLNPNGASYANSGSFVDGCDSYLVVQNGEVQLRYARDLKVAETPEHVVG
jgi:UDP-2,3-diacylglucosamine pyrophosphatase LpxH